MRQLGISRAYFLLGILQVAGCSILPHAPSVTDTHAFYAWPVDRCPSIPEPLQVERGAPLLGSLANILAGNAISALVGIPAMALAEAADADKKGFTAVGTNARFYYRVSKDSSGRIDAAPPGCYVVAYTQTDAKASAWCDDKSFNSGVTATCKNGKQIIESLYAKDHLKDQKELYSKSLAVPEFYAEIGFDRSGYEPIVRPRLVALYYPKSLLDPSSSKKRTVTISLALTSPENNDALKAASIALSIPGITPSPQISDEALVDAQTNWSSLPIIKPTKPLKEEGAYFPITITATLHEVGDPSLFLAAFSKAVSGSTSDISKAIGNAILPAGQAAAELQANTYLANYYSAHASALKSNSDYLAACSKNPSSQPDKQAAEALYYILLSNRQKANIAAATANVPPPFSSTSPDTQCF